MTHHYELREGVGSRGQTIFVVQAIHADGYGLTSHTFTTHAEALAWCRAMVAPFEDYSITR